jgi:hypothetical protein
MAAHTKNGQMKNSAKTARPAHTAGKGQKETALTQNMKEQINQ